MLSKSQPWSIFCWEGGWGRKFAESFVTQLRVVPNRLADGFESTNLGRIFPFNLWRILNWLPEYGGWTLGRVVARFCCSLVQTPVRQLLRFRAKMLVGRVLDTTDNAVSQLPAARSTPLPRRASYPVWVHSCPAHSGRLRPLAELSSQF